ncbi:MAG: DUF5337 domain-containing protein [Pseudomonadota bacterium]
MDQQKQRRNVRLTRRAALIMSIAMIAWLAVQFLGGRLGWPPTLVFAFDIAAILAFLWALWIVFQVYRARQSEEDHTRW